MRISNELEKAMIKLCEANLHLSQARNHCDHAYDPDRAAAGVHYNDITALMRTIEDYIVRLRRHKEEALAEGH